MTLEYRLLDFGTTIEEALTPFVELLKTLPDENVVNLSQEHCEALSALAKLCGSSKTFRPTPERVWADQNLEEFES